MLGACDVGTGGAWQWRGECTAGMRSTAIVLRRRLGSLRGQVGRQQQRCAAPLARCPARHPHACVESGHLLRYTRRYQRSPGSPTTDGLRTPFGAIVSRIVLSIVAPAGAHSSMTSGVGENKLHAGPDRAGRAPSVEQPHFLGAGGKYFGRGAVLGEGERLRVRGTPTPFIKRSEPAPEQVVLVRSPHGLHHPPFRPFPRLSSPTKRAL
ncbi:hypothetical protein C8Q78DRAFT_119505 [Trametes maxima]|nr:hypothetical protein C8Q78DRAFT_119505 [Trametes maxima]